MKNKLYRIFILFLTALIISAGISAVAVHAGDVTRTTVNIADAKKNVSGSGYEWDNINKILTLNGVNIDTEDPYGLRIPKNCTVILKGQNYIKASKYGISLLGTVVFKGNGSLTVDAGEIGLYLTSQDSTQKIRLLEGKYDITAGKYGVYSDYADFSFIGEEMNISVSDGQAIDGRIVNLLGGSFKADSTVAASHALTLDSVNIDVTSETEALSSKSIYLKNISLAEYNGEASVSAKSTAKNYKSSIIFGESVPAFVDYSILVLLLIGVLSGIFGPALRKKKKAEELQRRLEEEGYLTK